MSPFEPAVSRRRRLSFGIFLPQLYRWPDMLRHTLDVEQLGFESVWLADHFVNPYDAGSAWFEGWTTLAALAATTRTIRLGTAVTHIVYHNPAVLARTALTLDHISNGRLDLGMGVGSGGFYNYGMIGVPERPLKERVERYAESVILIDALLRQPKTTFEGTYFSVRDAEVNPRPVQQPRPPFNLAAHYPRSLRIAATYGDGWNSFYPGDDLSPEASSRITGERNERVTAYALEAGRDPSTIQRTFFVGYSADTPFAGPGALEEFVERYWAAGINEFVFGYAPEWAEADESWLGRFCLDRETLAQAAGETLPALRRRLSG